MGKIFYTDKSDYSSEEVIKKILTEFYGINNAVILRTENGKPYAQNAPFFSVSHTAERLFIAVSSKNVGLDAEHLSRKVSYAAIVKKFPNAEREEILSNETFLRHWVVKESAVKYLGGTLARDLSKLAFIQECLTYEGVKFPAKPHVFSFEGYVLSVCSEEDFGESELIPFPTNLL